MTNDDLVALIYDDELKMALVDVAMRLTATQNYKQWAKAMRKAGHTDTEISQETAWLTLACACYGGHAEQFAKGLKVG